MQNIYYINKQNTLTENVKKAIHEMNYNVRTLSKEVDLLEEKIDNAIEYIKNHQEERTYYTPEQRWETKKYFVEGYYELLEILGDKENE